MPKVRARQCGCLGDATGERAPSPATPRPHSAIYALEILESRSPRSFRRVRGASSGPLFRERREKTATLAGNVSGGSATARRVARDVLRDARRDRFPAPALTSFVPDLAETRRRPIQEPHPRGAQRQLPLAYQRRREEGTDDTVCGRRPSRFRDRRISRAVSTVEIRGRRLTVAFIRSTPFFPVARFHRSYAASGFATARVRSEN